MRRHAAPQTIFPAPFPIAEFAKRRRTAKVDVEMERYKLTFLLFARLITLYGFILNTFAFLPKVRGLRLAAIPPRAPPRGYANSPSFCALRSSMLNSSSAHRKTSLVAAAGAAGAGAGRTGLTVARDEAVAATTSKVMVAGGGGGGGGGENVAAALTPASALAIT